MGSLQEGRELAVRIHGLQKTTLLDYPGHVAATLFTGGCNFRCPFCHNGDLVLNPGGQPEIPMEEIMAFLKKRQGILDGVCITGGEPTLQSDLEEFISEVRELGYLIKLDTNGYRPQVLEQMLEKDLLDYVAMDIKASKAKYARAVGMDRVGNEDGKKAQYMQVTCADNGMNSGFSIAPIEKSVELLKESNIDYEFRTTVVKGIHCIEEFEEIGKWLSGCKAYYLQAFQENENVLAGRLAESEGDGCTKFSCYSRTDMEQMAVLAGKYIDKVSIRGIE